MLCILLFIPGTMRTLLLGFAIGESLARGGAANRGRIFTKIRHRLDLMKIVFKSRGRRTQSGRHRRLYG